METFEKTPTPREQLYTITKSLESLIQDEFIFYSKLAKEYDDTEIEVNELEARKSYYDDEYTKKDYDEDGEVTNELHCLPLLKGKLEVLRSEINTSLEAGDFTSLTQFITSAPDQLRDDLLIPVGESDRDIDSKLQVLLSVFNEYIDKVKRSLEEIDHQPEFDLS